MVDVQNDSTKVDFPGAQTNVGASTFSRHIEVLTASLAHSASVGTTPDTASTSCALCETELICNWIQGLHAQGPLIVLAQYQSGLLHQFACCLTFLL